MPHRPSYSGAELRAIRARNGVGRPISTGQLATSVGGAAPSPPLWWRPGTKYIGTVETRPMHAALIEHGSQRAAARALGMNLSTFQRRLAKEAASG